MTKQDDMERRRYHTDPTTGEFLLLEWITERNGWMPAMSTMEDWQCGAASIYRPADLPDTLVTMPNHNYWRALRQSEETDIIVLLGRPWIQNSHCQEIAQDNQIEMSGRANHQVASISDRSFDVIDAMEVAMNSEPSASAAYPPHIIDAVLDHAETTKKICPITMEPIQKQTATLTRCGHIFQKAALTAWLKTKSTCPECRLTVIP